MSHSEAATLTGGFQRSYGSTDHLASPMDIGRRSRITSVVSEDMPFFNTVFSGINLLLGIGLLALPMAFRTAGWLISSVLMLFCGGMTCHTAKLLGWMMRDDPSLESFDDMGHKAFGKLGKDIIGVMFVMEILAATVAMVILPVDTLGVLFEDLGEEWRYLIVFICIVPTTLAKSLNFLAPLSILGIASTIFLMILLIMIGLNMFPHEHGVPGAGALLTPAPTQLIADPLSSVPLSFGLMMSCYSGHSVFPTIYNEMKDKHRWEEFLGYTFSFVTVIAGLIAATGYRMYGLGVEDEITLNLISGHSRGVARSAIMACLGLIVINPICKFALTLAPVSQLPNQYFRRQFGRGTARFEIAQTVFRLGLVLFIFLIAYVLPDFDRVMAFLGALFSFSVSGIFPCLCHIVLERRKPGKVGLTNVDITNYCLVIVNALLAIVGTAWAFMTLPMPSLPDTSL